MCRARPWSLGLKFVPCNCYPSLRKKMALLSTGTGGWHHPRAMQMHGLSSWETPQGLFKNGWVGLVGSGGGEMLQTKATPIQRDHRLNAWHPWHGTRVDQPPWVETVSWSSTSPSKALEAGFPLALLNSHLQLQAESSPRLHLTQIPP